VRFYKEKPVSELQVTDRMAWERFAKDLKGGAPPAMPVFRSWCEANTSPKQYFCSRCYRPF
jgi:hypothetical protein